MGNWTTAVQELRTQLNDGGADRYCYRKRCFGDVNGANQSFKTYEFRRTTGFNTNTTVAPEGVYVSGALLAYTAVSSDDLPSGEFILVTAPTDGQVVEATYFYQWFEDAELETFLTGASRWLQIGDDFTNVSGGLTQAALDYASMLALRKMAMRWAMRASSSFLLEDAPKKQAAADAVSYSNMAGAFEKSAKTYRDDFYYKSGQPLSVQFASNWGQVSAVTPRQ